LTLQIGNFGVLIKRRTLVKSLVFILVSSLCYYLALSSSSSDPHDGYQIDPKITWPSFIEDCGKRVSYDTARRNYERMYYGKYVHWEG